ncbi:class I SAM-dependent DNA methyltransferase [Leptospira meyeri]|uniref:class I SAM-dependent DNA methyltransferase n=1 Tax=Leptospira meyeri TaxID=29508 RepID=UPI0002BE33C5|nr:DNA methyltransferase [Leptospira meyeri]EMJ87266.1 methyltransferase domain protein [Leptospira meyeri serovar Semaranga str. Veldrot Semarang 173]
MALSWNEIKDRAVRFSKEWSDANKEEAESQSFLNDFFSVFGITRKRVGTFEHRVKKLSESEGFIDLLWKGVILIEMKSTGRDLDKAFVQAKEYAQGLKESEVPKYILVCDFQTFRLYDTEDRTTAEFKLIDFVKNIQHFGLLAGYQKRIYKEQDPVNIRAAELLGKLHDKLQEVGYVGHPLEVFLVRLLFCLFAEDTTIFNKLQFQDFIEERTSEDGSDLAAKLQELFQVLNTAKDKRLKNLDDQLADFPYVNGKLFEETLPIASFDKKMRQALLDCCYLDWSKISPAIFGSMFQSVMNPEERRNLGAHYTSEKNILKLIKSLFLDDLQVELEACKGNKSRLTAFHQKLKNLRFLDPACGCGNFLVITYRELRLLEIELLKKLHKSDQIILDVSEILWLDVDMMYGIEYEEFPARIAEVAMWLIDHQMNMLASEEFGQYFVRLPLKKAANITHGNALRLNWEDVVPKESLSYIMGNPPFIGKRFQSEDQKKDMDMIFHGSKSASILDYVTAWYIKAAAFIQKTSIRVAFVSTNSIAQGEQVGMLWQILFSQYNIKIHFAHRTFAWTNEARGKAAVHVVIIGFANFDVDKKSIFEYDDIHGEPHAITAKNINPYLIDANDNFIISRKKPICDIPEISYGSMANDDGNLLLDEEEKKQLIKEDAQAIKFIRPFIGSYEFINGIKRWCIWLDGVSPTEISKIKPLIERINRVRDYRAKSTREATRKLADFPALFGEIRQPETNYLLIPGVSSENRKYIPIGYLNKNTIASDLARTLPNARLFHFGILTSLMHMTWVRFVCGRLKSDYRYSGSIVYNNFPWPVNPKEKHVKAIEIAAQKVLDIRSEYADISLANLYNPLTMPSKLVKAHNILDKAVDLSYRSNPFPNDAKRMEFLFELYEKYVVELFAANKQSKRK